MSTELQILLPARVPVLPCRLESKWSHQQSGTARGHRPRRAPEGGRAPGPAPLRGPDPARAALGPMRNRPGHRKGWLRVGDPEARGGLLAAGMDFSCPSAGRSVSAYMETPMSVSSVPRPGPLHVAPAVVRFVWTSATSVSARVCPRRVTAQ